MSAKSKRHNIRFEMLLTKEQNDSWQSLANSLGISKAELIRRRMAGCRIKTIPQFNWKCYWLLWEISQNIKGISQARTNGVVNDSEILSSEQLLFEKLKREIDKLRTLLILGIDESSNREKNWDDWES
jgi:hypothetical protein